MEREYIMIIYLELSDGSFLNMYLPRSLQSHRGKVKMTILKYDL